MATHFIIGGALSGKRAYADKLAKDSGLNVTYFAIAKVYDDEFRQRIEHHKEPRPTDWQIVDVSFSLAATLNIYANTYNFIIADCLTSKQ